MLSKGHAYEQQAEIYLIKQGYRLRDKNYFTHRGEIDLIMTRGRSLIFIEVRYRKHDAFGSPEESITKRKRDKIIYSAKHYINRHRLWHMNIRFDVITFSSQTAEKNLNPNWLQHAFTVD